MTHDRLISNALACVGHSLAGMLRVFIGIPILNRIDLLERCLGAIDHPADIVIVNNNALDVRFGSQLASMASRWEFTLIQQRRNLGVAASWNLLARVAFDRGHDWLFIGSNDAFLRPGSLKAALDIPKSSDNAVYHLHAFNFFLISRQTVEDIGWFDENFYPAYKEDQDFSYRCQLAGKHRSDVPGAGAEHVGSATIHSNPHYAARNAYTHCVWNQEYYLRKWGGDAGSERFTHPMNDPTRDHRWWPDPHSSIAERDWDRT